MTFRIQFIAGVLKLNAVVVHRDKLVAMTRKVMRRKPSFELAVAIPCSIIN